MTNKEIIAFLNSALVESKDDKLRIDGIVLSGHIKTLISVLYVEEDKNKHQFKDQSIKR